jgi:hypothetical protein
MVDLNKLTKLNKYTKTFLVAQLRKQLKCRTFDRETFKETYGLNTASGDQKVRRYLNEIAKETVLVTLDDLVFLKNYCIQNLTIKAANNQLDEATELKIALSGETQKFQVQQEITENKTVNIHVVKSLLTEYEQLFNNSNNEATRSEETVICTDHTT